MAITTGKVSSSAMATDKVHVSDPCSIIDSFAKSEHVGPLLANQRVEFGKSINRHFMGAKLRFYSESAWHMCRRPYNHIASREYAVLCFSTGTHNSETTECVQCSEDCADSRSRNGDGNRTKYYGRTSASPGLAGACEFVYNDAKFVNERARNDIILLSRSITRLNDRARQDFAILGLEFLKLDARAREDSEKIDLGMKKKAARLHQMATILKDKAQSKLKRAADKHWNDGALEADLRLADFCVRRRAMEDAFMALEFVSKIHDMMVSKVYKLPKKDDLSANNLPSLIKLNKNGKTLDFLPGEVSTDRITAIQEVYWSMASALSDADGIDYTDPEEV